MQNKKWTYLILGLGKTGISCAHYLSNIHATFAMADNRSEITGLDDFKKSHQQVEIFLGAWSLDILLQAEYLVISPGIALQEDVIAQALAQGVKCSSDVELFLHAISKPVAAITGSNGKSTVVSLLGAMAKAAGLNVPVAGNIGIPVLELLLKDGSENQSYDAYILELSSFQLERLSAPGFTCACILNISEDHMDRYASLEAYVQAKKIIYANAAACVSNRDDERTQCSNANSSAQQLSFGLNHAPHANFGWRVQEARSDLMQGDKVLMAASAVRLPGRHNLANALAALAIVHAMRWPLDKALDTLKVFTGLAHRCQFVEQITGATYVNDSKGTNVGATLAAIEGLCALDDKRVVLIVGGEGKGADFSPLVPMLKQYGRAAVCIGKEATALKKMLEQTLPCAIEQSMQQAVTTAHSFAQQGDYVLLSPACASFDMFKNFEHRGEVFIECVKQLKSASAALAGVRYV